MVDLIDTNGVKPTLKKGVLGYDDYSVGGDAGRLYVGTGTASIAQAKKSEVDSHTSNVSNPHSVTKTQVGLGNVDNTSDANKPISSATQSALDAKAPLSNPTFTGTVSGITKSMVGLGNVDNTSDVNKPVSTATQTALNTKVDKVTSTDNAIVRFDGTTGKVQNSGVIIDDNNTLYGKSIQSKVATNQNVTTQASVFNAGGVLFNAYNDAVSSAVPLEFNGSTLQFGTQNSERMRIDSAGNVGIGITPSAWGSSGWIELGATFGLTAKGGLNMGSNWYYNNGYKYTTSAGASNYFQQGGQHQWNTAPSGTAGNAITWTNAMTLDSSGNLNVGTAGSAWHRIVRSAGIGTILLMIDAGGGDHFFQQIDSTSYNAANTGLKLGRNTSTGRSLNAAGTINASGADYAEYEYSNDITLVKGQIVGFKEDGTLTDKYSESIRFSIKSTNPSIVGGDTWGTEETVGKKPEQPVKTEEMSDEEFAKLEEQYEKDLADFETRLEAERQKVDRIAYAGKVPVNVYGAVAGQYVIAVEKEDGTIDGKLVNKTDMTFSEYQDAVGRVNKILDDGRAEVAVIIH